MKTVRKALSLIGILLFALGNAQAGRWLSPDPIEQIERDPPSQADPNLYQFVGNNPINFFDPFGLQMSGSATLALDPTLLMTEEEIAAFRAAAKVTAAAAATAATLSGDKCETRQYGKGERNWQHTSDNPWKGWRVDPKDPTKIRGKDQNGKEIVKPRPPDFPDPKPRPTTPAPQKPLPQEPKPPEPGK
jgi:hypothetical protein